MPERILMDSLDKTKIVVASFLNCTPDQITEDTKIDRESMRSSIMIHRLFATLKDEGINIEDYTEIRTFEELIKASGTKITEAEKDSLEFKVIGDAKREESVTTGIDIEKIDNFPTVMDYREDSFYKQNFSPIEIAYCILKPNPKESFAGLFAAKEAIVKADHKFHSLPFSKIEIIHDQMGKPLFEGFSISISHTDHVAVAVAVKITTSIINQISNDLSFSKSKNQTQLILIIIALVILNIILLLKFIH